VTLFLFQNSFKRGRQKSKTAANTSRFKEKRLIFDDWIASKIMLFIHHKRLFLRSGGDERERMARLDLIALPPNIRHTRCQTSVQAQLPL
jgi:hypothetical protein